MSNNQKQVMDIKVSKTFTRAQSNEHKRNWTDGRWEKAADYGNYDRTRQHLNFEIVEGKIKPLDTSKTICQTIKESLEKRGIVDPNKGLPAPKFRTVVNFIFGGSREVMRQLAYEDQDVNFDKNSDNSHIVRKKGIEDWALDIYNFVAEKYGEENIAGFTVHLDETNPHIHCTLLPIRDGKFAYKKIFAGKDIYEYSARMKNLHDDLAKVNEKYGLSRGEPVGETNAKHKATKEYRYELSRECATLEEQVENYKLLIDQLKLEVAHAEKRVKGLNTMIYNLEEQQAHLEAEIEQLKSEISAGKGDQMQLSASIKKLEKDYEKVTISLADKRQKLLEANRKLSEFKELENESRLRLEESREQEIESRERLGQYRESLGEAAKDLAQQVQFRISDAAMDHVLAQLKSVIPNLFDPHNMLDSSLLNDLAERGDEILKCAGMLFAGYIDGAIQFAESHGGGGSDLGGWGRRDDEDDREFSRRCLLQSAKMLRPSTGPKLRRK